MYDYRLIKIFCSQIFVVLNSQSLEGRNNTDLKKLKTEWRFVALNGLVALVVFIMAF